MTLLFVKRFFVRTYETNVTVREQRRDRARIVDQPNRPALEHISISFNDSCCGKLLPISTQTRRARELWLNILAADPTNVPQHGLVKKHREIQQKLQLKMRLRDRFVLRQSMSIRAEDVSR